jgi:environmental stress-induced protein Ves
MNWNLVRLSDVAPVPWRNGGGVTRELAVSSARDDWHWRMSVAEVDASGPFSRFEGIDRWFAVLEGAGVLLDVQGDTHQITHSSAPFYFDGGALTHCTLLDGRTQDFNLMVRRGSAPARMLRIHAPTNFVLTAPKIIAIYSIAMPARVQFGTEHLALAAGSLVWRQASAGTTVAVTAEDALWMEIEPCP